jgi:secretion/DNA translocation related TadE-like protein
MPFTIACLGLLLVLGAALGVVAALVHAHREAQSAADLAALAGAGAVGRGAPACPAAAGVAAANTARLTQCVVDGRVVAVQVEVAGPHWLGQTADLSARARAGPG